MKRLWIMAVIVPLLISGCTTEANDSHDNAPARVVETLSFDSAQITFRDSSGEVVGDVSLDTGVRAVVRALRRVLGKESSNADGGALWDKALAVGVQPVDVDQTVAHITLLAPTVRGIELRTAGGLAVGDAFPQKGARQSCSTFGPSFMINNENSLIVMSGTDRATVTTITGPGYTFAC